MFVTVVYRFLSIGNVSLVLKLLITSVYTRLKAMLHYATCFATCLATDLFLKFELYDQGSYTV